MNFKEALKDNFNFGYTENGATKHLTTKSALLDLFALGGSYRNRSEDDVILLFKKAFEENEEYAMKCLFYLRDCRSGAGERRFSRVCMTWLANNHPAVARRNMKYIYEYGRYDDYYCFVGTPLEDEAFNFLDKVFTTDLNCKTPSLCAKWLKSVNSSSKETCALGRLTAKKFGLSEAAYRRHLSALRKRINVVETLISQNRWNEIQYDKIPSRAGLIYRNAFARHDYERYKAFVSNKNTKVNSSVLTPVDIANNVWKINPYDKTERLALQKYWDNLPDYYNGRKENGIAIVDVSGSMYGEPINAAISMGAYIAQNCEGAFKNHFITFSANPELVEFEGIDIYDKFRRARNANWGYNTNIQAVFDLLLRIAVRNRIPANEMPERLYIFSDMEFDRGMGLSHCRDKETLFESIAKEWRQHGYELPKVIFWNLDARNDNIPVLGERYSYISGFSMSMVEQILGGKTGYELMMDKLNTDRYRWIS